ncbi:hypothetical protein ABMA28_005556 [Loxostege sticticalis]|uniref:Uncharacterized protein n=1 Tax=Loxostege sticticalis TaxID=481309 RepID=A0ABD0SMR3_LOXSC
MILSTIFFLIKSLCCISIAFFAVLILIKIWLKLNTPMCTCKVRLDEKTVVVTGGNMGIGFETAKTLARRGARVVIASRNEVRSRAAVEAIIEATGNPRVEYKPLDLSKLSSVKQFADDFNKHYDRLDVLINNAAFNGFGHVKTEDGIEKVMQVNHVAPVYLTNLLLDKIVGSKPSRIIFVSSGAHNTHAIDPDDLEGRKPVNIWTKYSNSKVCNVLSAKALAKCVPERVAVNSLHPGVAKTELYDMVPWPLDALFNFVLENVCKTPEECAQTTIHLACSPHLERVTGQYFNDLEVDKTHPSVTDELADRVWENTIALIEDRTRRYKN